MKKTNLKKLAALALALILVLALAACDSTTGSTQAANNSATQAANNSASNSATQAADNGGSNSAANTEPAATNSGNSNSGTVVNTSADGALDTADLFSKRDLEQTADLSEAVTYTVSDGSDITITAAGVYVLTGAASEVTVVVEAGDEDKVQLVLDNLSITNTDSPAIYVKNADKVFLTTAADSENSLSVTGTFTADGSTNTDAVIFSRDDLVLNGLGSLTIVSTDNGVSCKDDLKVAGGTLTITAGGHGLEANESIAIADGVISISAKADGLHAENDDDYRTGWVYVCGGVLSVSAGDDGLHANTIVQIDGGTVTITAAEGIEATWVQINGGSTSIAATDDGINGANKSSAYTACVEITGGELTVNMGQGDTDGIDSNGNLIITGGTVSVTGQSAFDWDGTLTWTGGTVYINGSQATEITNQFAAGGGGSGGGGGRR